jgi:hypothetical protein
VVDHADVSGVTGERGELVAAERVIVVRHCIGEASDDGFGNICTPSVESTVWYRLTNLCSWAG